MVWDALTEFEQASVAVQVLTISVGHTPFVRQTSTTWTFVPQLSVAVTFAGGVTSPRHSKRASDGTPLSIGSVVSTTVMVCEQVLRLVQASSASHVRVAENVFPQKPTVLVTVPTMRMV